MGNKYSFSVEEMFSREEDSELLAYRDDLFNKFNRNMRLLMESKKPRKQHSHKGRLDTRKVYQYPFNDSIFQKSLSQPTSNTTVIMLIDGSGSMEARGGYNSKFTRMDVCNAVCSAFAKSVKTVINDELKVEVFVKSSPSLYSEGGAVKGDFVTLTRVFSNVKAQSVSKYDRLLNLKPVSPVKVGSHCVGSYTSEFSVLPGLFRWMRKNITTKNTVFFNLTDGEAYASLGTNGTKFLNADNAYMRTKYLRGENEMTMIIGEPESHRKSWVPVYGDNLVMAEGNFEADMFRVLMKLMDTSYE